MNLEQVARRARVSTATVSRVLNNAGVVKNTTRARVMKAIAELKICTPVIWPAVRAARLA